MPPGPLQSGDHVTEDAAVAKPDRAVPPMAGADRGLVGARSARPLSTSCYTPGRKSRRDCRPRGKLGDMQTASGFPYRRSVRLRDCDYCGPADYFITICSFGKRCTFGECSNGEVRLSRLGQFVDEQWRKIPEIRPGVTLDTFQVMPNHFHGVLFLPAESDSPIRQQLSNVIKGFKSAVTSNARAVTGNAQLVVWQRGFYDHVIRTERALRRIRAYIEDNPWNWNDDPYHPQRLRG